jgi:hypothetical protein
MRKSVGRLKKFCQRGVVASKREETHSRENGDHDREGDGNLSIHTADP